MSEEVHGQGEFDQNIQLNMSAEIQYSLTEKQAVSTHSNNRRLAASNSCSERVLRLRSAAKRSSESTSAVPLQTATALVSGRGVGVEQHPLRSPSRCLPARQPARSPTVPLRITSGPGCSNVSRCRSSRVRTTRAPVASSTSAITSSKPASDSSAASEPRSASPRVPRVSRATLAPLRGGHVRSSWDGLNDTVGEGQRGAEASTNRLTPEVSSLDSPRKERQT